MRSLPDRFNDRLEQHIAHRNNGKHNNDIQQSPPHSNTGDPELEAFIALAQHLQQATPLQVDPDFAQHLEKRILIQQRTLQTKRSARYRKSGLSFLFPHRLSLVPIMSLFCLVLFLGTGVLAFAAQSSGPNGALYPLKNWEQHLQISLAQSPLEQAKLSLQVARERLQELPGLTRPPDTDAYQQALNDLDQQLLSIDRVLAALPAGPDRDYLANEYMVFKANVRDTLYGVLLQLNLPEQLATTSVLGRVGASIPHLQQALITLLPHPKNQIIISVTGGNLYPGVRLLINNQPVQSMGSLQNDAYVFIVNWTDKQFPRVIGILNPDGTAARTTMITTTTSDNNYNGNDNNKNGNGNSNGDNGHGHGNGNGKPISTPVPPHH